MKANKDVSTCSCISKSYSDHTASLTVELKLHEKRVNIKLLFLIKFQVEHDEFKSELLLSNWQSMWAFYVIKWKWLDGWVYVYSNDSDIHCLQFEEQGWVLVLLHFAEPGHVSRAYVYLDDSFAQQHGKLHV